MPSNSEFDKFLADQRASQTRHGNLTDRRSQWLRMAELLYVRVTELLDSYLQDGSMKVERSSIEVREELLGTYDAPTLAINLGGSTVQFVPVGTFLLGSPGRVDLVGNKGRVRFVLVPHAADRPMMTGVTRSESADVEAKPTRLDFAAYTWKISTLPPGIRYSAIEVNSLQSAIMEAANGHSRHR